VFELIIGTAFSGKESLLKQNLAKNSTKKPVILLPERLKDVQLKSSFMSSEISKRYKVVSIADNYQKYLELVGLFLNDTRYLVINNLQFFGKGLLSLIEILIQREDIDIVASSWQSDIHGKPLDLLCSVIPYADRIYKLSSSCFQCGEERATHNIPSTTTGFTPVCHKCFLELAS
jgi:thymidine kinase